MCDPDEDGKETIYIHSNWQLQQYATKIFLDMMNFGLKNKIFGDEDVARFQEQFNSEGVILVDAVRNAFEGLDIWHFNAFLYLDPKT